MYRFPLNFFLFFNQFYIIELSNKSPPPTLKKSLKPALMNILRLPSTEAKLINKHRHNIYRLTV